jgi:N-acetylated-alpha-linked acidic dipeptidase
MPQTKEAVPKLDFKTLETALSKLNVSVQNYQRASAEKQLSPDRRAALDKILYGSERLLTLNTGLPRRDWFKHQIYAPGYYTGYGVKTLPAIREAIEQRDWREATEQIGVVSKVIENFAAEIDKAAALYQ